MMKINEQLAQAYEKRRLVPKAKLLKILEEIKGSNVRLDKALKEKRLITSDGNAVVYADIFNMDYMNITTIQPDPDIVKRVTSTFIERHEIIPICMIDNAMLVAIANPFDYEGLRKINSFAGDHARIVVDSRENIMSLKNIIFSRSSTAEAIEGFSSPNEEDDDEANLYEFDVQNAPAVKLTDSLFREAVANNASDVHIEPMSDTVRVRYRVDGVLYKTSTLEKKMYPAVLTRIKIIAGINIAKKRLPQDGRIKHVSNDIEYDLRVSTLPTIFGERIVIRILDTEAFSFERTQLGFTEIENRKVDSMLRQPHGIILLTGPTGCGKTTTLYSFIKELNTEMTNIITVEDPVEYTVKGVSQVQVNTQAGFTFAKALRSILRQDPNIIMLGEIRDEETAQIAVRAAITGHLVFSTLHTNDAAGTITRLLDMGIEPYFVADAIIGVVAQRLVRRLCQNCRRRFRTKQAEMDILGISEPKTIYKAAGCPACNNTGYKGRLGIHEILIMDDEVKEFIQLRVSTEKIRQKALEKGMLTLYDTCRIAVLNGVTTISELSKILYEKDLD